MGLVFARTDRHCRLAPTFFDVRFCGSVRHDVAFRCDDNAGGMAFLVWSVGNRRPSAQDACQRPRSSVRWRRGSRRLRRCHDFIAYGSFATYRHGCCDCVGSSLGDLVQEYRHALNRTEGDAGRRPILILAVSDPSSFGCGRGGSSREIGLAIRPVPAGLVNLLRIRNNYIRSSPLGLGVLTSHGSQH